MIETLYKPGFSSKRLSDSVDTGGAANEDVATDSTNWPLNYISFPGHIRRLSATEMIKNDKREVMATHRLYCGILDITAEDRVFDPDGNEYDVVSVDNPHQLDKFMQIDLVRHE